MRGSFIKELRENPIYYLRTHPEMMLIPLVFIVFVGLWEAIIWFYEVPIYLVAPPSKVLKSLIYGINNGVYFLHFRYTISAVLLGFAIGAFTGLFLGALISQFPLLEKTLYPYIVAFQTLPKIAIAPLLILWLGFGISSKVAMAAMVCFFPVLVNVVVGLKSTDQDKIDLMRSLSATNWQIFRMVKLPNSLPYLFAGLDIGIVFSVLAVIVGEFVGSQMGLGNLILQMNFNLDVPGVFSVLIILSAIGVSLHLIMQKIHKKLVFWAERERVMGA